MSKSPYTDTDKWQKPWFRALSPLNRLGFLFILDRVNAGGIYEHDPETYEFFVGEEVVDPALIFQGLVFKCDRYPSCFFVPSFIEFQYRAGLPAGSKISESIWRRWEVAEIMPLVRRCLPPCYLPPKSPAADPHTAAGEPIIPSPGEKASPTAIVKKRPKPTVLWQRVVGPEAAEVWARVCGGEINWGVAASVLPPLYRKYGKDKALRALEKYLTTTEGKYISLPAFAGKVAKYMTSEDKPDENF